MKNRIGIIEHWDTGVTTAMAQAIMELERMDNDVVILNPSDLKNNQQEINTVFDNPPIPYKAAPKLESFFGEKEFKCKGKHQYREVKTKEDVGNGEVFIKIEWVCQCGRKIND